ncbi:MAG: hypothetical protein FJY54_16470 [Betaproteobacteria bacterium]|nr:hypothetical protein [Betaproteobacteria bacterium]
MAGIALTPGGLAALGLFGAPSVSPMKWVAVWQRFEQFHRNLGLTVPQQQDAQTKYAGVVGCLNRWYYGHASTTHNGFPIGSWGKNTMVRLTCVES